MTQWLNKLTLTVVTMKNKPRSSSTQILYFQDGKVAKDGIVYCGNILSETELQTLGMDAITKKLSNRFGNQKANFRVPSGKELPFMVVFNELPENLGEFSVEVVDSIPG